VAKAGHGNTPELSKRKLDDMITRVSIKTPPEKYISIGQSRK
jgi:hypothetical protein